MFGTALAVLAGLAACTPGDSGPVLPTIPVLDVIGLPDGVREQIRVRSAALEETPDSADANGKLAMVLHAYAMYEPAAALYERASALAPSQFRWVYLHGLTLRKLGRLDEAANVLDRAMAMRPRDASALLAAAELAAERGRHIEAMRRYGDIVAVLPELAPAHYGLGRAHQEVGEPEDAVRSLDRAVQIFRAFGPAHYALAAVHRQLGNAEAARRHAEMFERYGQEVPSVDDPLMTEVLMLNESERGLQATALEHLRRRRPGAAAEVYERMVADNPSNVAAMANLVGLYGNLGDPDKAEAHYRAGIAIDPALTKLHNNIGVVRLNDSRLDAAAEAFAEAIRLDPTYASPHKNLGAVHERAGRSRKALQHYRTAVELDPEDRQARYFLGRLLSDNGQYPEAARELERIIEPLDRRSPFYLRALAAAYAGQQDTARAIETLERARGLAGSALIAAIDNDLAKLRRQGGAAASSAP